MNSSRDSPDAASTSARVPDLHSSSAIKFEVFLSFRGPDTRNNFTDHLYHDLVSAGVRVFRDNEEIRKGEKIEGELQHAIECSKVYVPIFSKSYAKSAWCLRELTYLVKCAREATDKVILPIFYDVKPDDVKLKDDAKHKSLYLDYLKEHTEEHKKHKEKHKEKFGKDDVEEWKKALIEVGKIKGWELQGKGEGEIKNFVISKILTKVTKGIMPLPDHLVGIQYHLQKFMELLWEDSPYLVIHGMGGIGKTTLAKAVFNRILENNHTSNQFEVCCFLSDIHESEPPVQRDRIMDLQRQLLSKLGQGTSLQPHSSVAAGIELISTRFRCKKVLLILDDVNTKDQLSSLAGKKDWFGSESKIIITTRHINFLPIEEEDQGTSFQARSREFVVYDMKEMDSSRSLQLLSRHAFKKDSPPIDYEDIAREISCKIGGIPLVLEVLGSSLFGQNLQAWIGLLEELKMVPNDEVFNKLKISYDRLEDLQKRIFLDIACFFIGEERLPPCCMWEASGYSPNTNLLVLTGMSLIKIVKNDIFWMHDQTRDFGREIVKREGIDLHGQRSRLWEPEIAFDVVRMKEVIKNVVALRLRGLPEEYNFTSEEFSKMPYLRFLELEGGNLVGDFKNVFLKLTWFSWSNCPSELNATNLRLKKLVMLELSGSNITEDWAGWETCLMSENLKVIRITQCPKLRRTPNFSKCTKFKKLLLQSGKNSIVMDGSLSQLVIEGFGQYQMGCDS